jgi:hypothetical protein
MNTKFSILITLIFISISCSKNYKPVIENRNIALTGKWGWTKSQGGISGGVQTPTSTNKIINLEISNDRIKFFENGNLLFDKSYTIETKQSIYGGQKQMIVYEQNFKSAQSFEIIGTQLVLNDECYDCFTNEYSKR